MRFLWLPIVLLAMLALAPTAAAEGPEDHPHGGPPGHDDGHPGPGDGSGGEDPSDTDVSGAETHETTATTVYRDCRVVEWDGGDPEPGVNPLLGLVWIDPDRCITSALHVSETLR